MRGPLAIRVRGAIEGGVLALVCLGPWALGSTAPRYEFLLELGVAGLLVLWGVRILLERRMTWRRCPVAACLAVLVLVTAWQLVPLPKNLLRLVSPATSRMYDRLLPGHPEVLPGGEQGEQLTPHAGSTLTFDRGSTRRDLGRLLAILALFAIVRNNVDPARGLRRLGLATLANGSLLAFFGLVQAFSSGPHLIYWSYQTVGSPFGPFINRNHFAFYVNVCVGLGIGLLLGRSQAGGDRGPGGGGRWARPVIGLLRDPGAIGFIFGLGLMIGGVALSLSRGGFLALLGGLVFGAVLWIAQTRERSPSGLAVLLAPSIALALLCWFGFDQVVSRLATLQGGEILQEQRLAIWARALPVVREFPLWGTGSGTYEFADMLHRADARDTDTIVDHAHNDYLELLVEGGLSQFLPGVLALVLVFKLGLRATRRLKGTATGGLAIGGLVSLATVAIHSLTDFGLHIPSCVALVVVLASLLSGLGSVGTDLGTGLASKGASVDEVRVSIRHFGLAPILGAGSALALGLLIAHEGWRAHRVREIEGQASDLDRSGDSARLGRKAALLEEALHLAPEDYLLREYLVSAYLNAYEQYLFELTELEDQAGSALPKTRPSAAELSRLKRLNLAPALRHLLRSRDLCPMRAFVQMEIAERVGDFEAAEPLEAYLERAKLLAPGDPGLWYRSGSLELAAGQPDRAWASWRHSLELSDRFLPKVLDQTARHLGPRDLLDRVLPEDPDLLLEAARLLTPGSVEGRRTILEGALARLDRQPDRLAAEDQYLRATIYRSLGRPEEALAAYRSALAREPMRHDWRYQLAELSSERGRHGDARQELLTIVGLRPGDERARALLDEVTRKLVEGR